MTSTLDHLTDALTRAARKVRLARVEIAWITVWQRIPAPLLFLGRLGASVTLGEAQRELDQRITGGGLAYLNNLSTTLADLRKEASRLSKATTKDEQ
jgi:hypothetical protein